MIAAHSPGRIGYASGKLPYNRLLGHLIENNVTADTELNELVKLMIHRSGGRQS